VLIRKLVDKVYLNVRDRSIDPWYGGLIIHTEVRVTEIKKVERVVFIVVQESCTATVNS
jgi:hypothetical protein